MDDFREVIDAWPKPAVPTLAKDISTSAETVKKWHQRKRIPSFWWPKVIEAAHERNIDISLEKLVALETQSRRAS